MAITDTDYLKTIAAYAESLGGTAEPDSEAEVNARLDTEFSTLLGDWYGAAYNFDRNGTAATATITFNSASFPITNGQTIKITDAFGTEITYTVATSQDLNAQQFAGVTSNDAIAASLKACVDDSNATDIVAAGCHGGTITATVDANVVTLTQDVEGTDGNKTIDISGFSQDIISVSHTLNKSASGISTSDKKGFSGGLGKAGSASITILANVAATKKVTLISEDGGEGASAFTSQDYEAKSGTEELNTSKFKGNGGDVTVIAKSLHDCIINSDGNNNNIVVSQNAGVLTIKQKRAGSLGNTTIATDIAADDATISSAFTGAKYGFTGIGSVLPGSALMTFTDHGTNNNPVIKSAISSAFKSFCKIKK